MNFVFPNYFWLFLFLLVPVIVHLFYFKRYMKMDFTMVHFLKSLQEKNQSKKQIKHLLILSARILMFIALVLAFAQPFISGLKNAKEQGNIAIYIDNSYSLSSTDGDQRFKELKSSALALIDINKEQNFIVLNNQLTSQSYAVYDANGAMHTIQKMKLVGTNVSYHALNSFINSAKDISELYCLSDFQSSFFLEEVDVIDVPTKWLPLTSNTISNVSIDTMWLSSPFIDKNRPVDVVFKLSRNLNEDEYQQKVDLYINGVNRGFVNVDFKLKSSAQDTIRVQLNEGGLFNSSLKIEDQGLQFDNSYSFILDVANQINVLSVAEGNQSRSLSKLFNQFEFIRHDTVGYKQINYATLDQYDIIFVHGIMHLSTGLIASLQSWVKSGKDLVIIPSRTPDLLQYNNLSDALDIDRLLSNKTEQVSGLIANIDASVFKVVFEEKSKRFKLPKVKWSYYIELGGHFAEKIISTDFGSLCNKYTKGAANVYLFGFDFDQENISFKEHAVFPLLLYNITIESMHVGRLAYNANKDKHLNSNGLNLNFGDQFKLKSENGTEQFVTVKRHGGQSVISLDAFTNESGIYRLNRGDSTLHTYAFNYDREETKLNYYSASELKNIADDKGVSVISISNKEQLINNIQSRHTSLWKVCLILAAIFLLLEIAFIKFL